MIIRLSSVAFAALLAASVPALAAEHAAGDAKSGSAMSGSAQSGSAQSASNPSSDKLASQDRQYMQQIARVNIAEIAAGKMAEDKAQSEKVKQYGEHMVKDHSEAQDKLKEIAQKYDVNLPSEPDKAHQRQAKDLAKLSGDKFDDRYMTDMVRGHRSAVNLLEKTVKSAKNDELKQYAQTTLDTIKGHLQGAQKIAAAEKKQDTASSKGEGKHASASGSRQKQASPASGEQKHASSK